MTPSALATPAPLSPAGGAAARGARAAAPWLWAGALAALLAAVYLIVSPPSGDLAAATYRSDLFARAGFTIWDNGWYDGHALPAYSLLAPALGAWLGVRVLLALSAVLASVLFGVLARRAFPPGAALAASLAFAFGFCAELPSGRVPYDLGAAVALAAAIAMSAPAGGRRPAWALAATIALALATTAASPVAGAFLALAGVALALSRVAGGGQAASATRPARSRPSATRSPSPSPSPSPRPSAARIAQPLAAAAAALAAILALAGAFPEGGFEPFAAGAFWPELAAAVAFAALLPSGTLGPGGRRAARIAAALYALALTLSFLILTPMGGNVVRLGAMFGAPVIVGVLWSGARLRIGGGAAPSRVVLLALAPLLLYWQLATAIDDQVALAGDPTVHASFFAPLRHELLRLSGGAPIRVEVPLMNSHWESAYLPGGPISIARGWERQLDTRYDMLFYRPGLTAFAFERWLHENAVAYVALPDVRLDSAGRQERRLIERGLPYLREVWHGSRWRLFDVQEATPLAQPPARLTALGPDSFTLRAPRPGGFEVRVRFTPYWALQSGAGCVSQAGGGFTEVRATRAGSVRVAASFALGRVFSHGPRCRP